jgi:DNA mismatch repair ATPase MutS
MSSPKESFQIRINKFQLVEKELKTKTNNWTLIRGAAFLFAVVATYFAVKNYGNGIAILTFAISFGFFLFIVSNHLKLVLELRKAQLFGKINLWELNKLDNNFTGISNGLNYAIQNHNYASDLDLFGSQSVFQLLNRTHTYAGGQLLADWLNNPAPKPEIIKRQDASIDLLEKIEFRQNFEVVAILSDKVGNPTSDLLNWIQQPHNETIEKPLFKYGKQLPYLTLVVLIGAILGFYTYYFVGLILLIQGIILKLIDKEAGEALTQTEPAGETLKPYSELMQLIEKEQFTSKKLQELSAKIEKASKSVAKLGKIIHQLSYRSNPIAALGSIIFMLDLKNFINLENWKAENKNKLANWLDVVSEFEALNSLSGYQFANPDFTIPQISDEAIVLNIKELGHPMIHSKNRVYNDFSINVPIISIILTGSNMSGKSTFERTVGVNIVLSLMGAVVCAKELVVSEMRLFTSMRTQDSLEYDTSSFYAELKRLEQLIKLTNRSETGKPIFYLLDEVLKGTNSKDRHAGAKALILQLKNKNSAGIISTHDVELGDEFEGNEFVKNYSFSSEMIGNQLVFDYKLKNGVCHSFNASELMRRIGIEIAT